MNKYVGKQSNITPEVICKTVLFPTTHNNCQLCVSSPACENKTRNQKCIDMNLMQFTTILAEWENIIPYDPPGASMIKDERHIIR